MQLKLFYNKLSASEMDITKKVKNFKKLENKKKNISAACTTCTVNISQIFKFCFELIYSLTIFN